MDDITASTSATDTSAVTPTPEPRNPILDIEEAIERWWDDHFPGSPVAQVTQAWNHAFAAKEELKRRLKALSESVTRS